MAAPAEYFITGGSSDHQQRLAVEDEYKKKFRYLGASLTICGVVAVFNAQIASSVEAEKSYQMEDYVNTHWLTSIFLFAGMSAWLFGRFIENTMFLFIMAALNFMALPVAILSFVADVLNLSIVANIARTRYRSLHLKQSQVIMMMIYNSIDMIGCLIALGMILFILYHMSRMRRRLFDEQQSFLSYRLAAVSVALAALGCAKIEVLWVRQMAANESKMLFLHYTLDEPVWMAIHVLVGALGLQSALKGNRITMYISFAVALMSLQPIMMYLWLDYRWFCQVRINEMTVVMPKQDAILGVNMFLGVMQLTMSCVLLGMQVQVILDDCPLPKNLHLSMTIDKKVQRSMAMATVIYFGAGLIFLLSDLINLYHRTFYRVFYPTEQKLPILLMALGAVCTGLLNKNWNLYTIPLAVLLLLVVLHTFVFHVAAFLYLSYNNYFRHDICDMFFYSQNTCEDKLERLGTLSHFFEAFFSLGVSVVASYMLATLIRISRLHRVQLGAMTISEMRLKQRAEKAVMYLGIFIMTAGIIVFGLTINQGGFLTKSSSNRGDHPLVVIHMIIYRSCVALSLIIYPAIQIYYSFNLVFHPLRVLTLMIISIYRFAEVITQLDYRNVGEDGGISWSLFSLVDFFAMCASFFTVCICSALLHAIYNRSHDAPVDEAAPNGRDATISRAEQMQSYGWTTDDGVRMSSREEHEYKDETEPSSNEEVLSNQI